MNYSCILFFTWNALSASGNAYCGRCFRMQVKDLCRMSVEKNQQFRSNLMAKRCSWNIKERKIFYCCIISKFHNFQWLCIQIIPDGAFIRTCSQQNAYWVDLVSDILEAKTLPAVFITQHNLKQSWNSVHVFLTNRPSSSYQKLRSIEVLK